MRLVVDANVLFSAVIKDSKTRQLLRQSRLRLIAPKELLVEFEANRKEILKKSGLSDNDFLQLVTALLQLVAIIENTHYQGFLKHAFEICPDKKDVPYFALCLFEGIPLWSNEKKLKEQKIVKVYSTSDLLALIKT